MDTSYFKYSFQFLRESQPVSENVSARMGGEIIDMYLRMCWGAIMGLRIQLRALSHSRNLKG